MTNEEMRIAIVGACPSVIIQTGNGEWFYATHVIGQPVWHKCVNNDPLEDLNAMHEAEARFNNSKDADTYMRNLLLVVCNLITREDSFILNSWTAYALAHATDAQRAEAFCRTVYPEKFKDI